MLGILTTARIGRRVWAVAELYGLSNTHHSRDLLGVAVEEFLWVQFLGFCGGQVGDGLRG